MARFLRQLEAVSEEVHVIADGLHLGAESPELLDELWTLLEEDPDAFDQLCWLHIQSRSCTIFTLGDRVHVLGLTVRLGEGPSLIHPRLEGEHSEYWTLLEAIEDPLL